MIDKLVLITPSLRRKFEQLALEKGSPAGGYERVVDLRKLEGHLPVGISFRGGYTGIHKLEVFKVAQLGLTRTTEILRSLVPTLNILRIYRIDACVDLLGKSPWDLAVNCNVPNVQNFRLYRSRGAVSIYLQSSYQRTLLVYDRGKRLRTTGDTLATVFRPDDKLTRVEVQLKGQVPFKRFDDIWRYADYEWLGELRFDDLKLESEKSTPIQWLAANGLRELINKYGLQAASKRFDSPEWAALRKKFLEPMTANKIPSLRLRLKKSITNWLQDRLYFPRGRDAGKQSRV